ncbi:MAG: hypothetical protein ACRDBO_03235 [Lachnospiraceae bacterium]
MLRQNRYKDIDFIRSPQELELIQGEIIVSKAHDIVIALEPDQVGKFEELQTFIMRIIREIPILDNETQDYYETISTDTDFPHSLSVVYFEENRVILDYWSDEFNNQFSIVFSFENGAWLLKTWNAKEIPLNWRSYDE